MNLKPYITLHGFDAIDNYQRYHVTYTIFEHYEVTIKLKMN